MLRISIPIRVTVIVSFLILAAGTVQAAPLDKPACAAAEAELARYVASGILVDIAKGPEWAAANLPAARMQDIAHYFDVMEQLKFRCRPEKPAAKPKPAAAKADGPKAAGQKAIGPKPPVKPARPQQNAVRANDAYVPPPGLESTFDLPRPAIAP